MKTQTAVWVMVVALFLVIALVMRLDVHEPFHTEQAFTMRDYNKLYDGMPYSEAVGVLGIDGQEVSRVDIADDLTVAYSWRNQDGSNIFAMFQGGGMVSKAQFALPVLPPAFEKEPSSEQTILIGCNIRGIELATKYLPHLPKYAPEYRRSEAWDGYFTFRTAECGKVPGAKCQQACKYGFTYPEKELSELWTEKDSILIDVEAGSMPKKNDVKY